MRRIALVCALATIAVPAYADCRAEEAPNDERCTLEASAFLGIAIEQFAAGEYGRYVYAPSGSTSNESSIFGFDVSARLYGRRHDGSTNASQLYDRQWWFFAETVHGIRSADINCSSNASFPSCQSSMKDLANPQNVGQTSLAILRGATSLEGYVGLRYEFLSLNRNSVSPADATSNLNLYFKGQAGFLKVSGTPGSALDMHKLAVGVIDTKGDFTGSYVDVGYGRNDVFQYNRRRRAIVDAYLQRKLTGGVSFFAQLVSDSDLGKGSDSFHTYIGVNFDLDHLLR